MKIHSISYTDIIIGKNRQRKSTTPEAILELAGSIERIGLIHPIVVRRDDQDNILLVAGERRMKAMHYIWDLFDGKVSCGEYEFDKGMVPCLWMGELDPLDAFEMELEENIRRVDLTWQERSENTALLLAHRQAQAESRGEEPPNTEALGIELYGPGGDTHSEVRAQTLVAKHLGDPEIQKAKSAKDALKILKRREETERNVALARSVGATLNSSSHTLRQGDCLEILPDLVKESFDVILTDPPYGIDADQFNDSGGRAAGSHFYGDSWTSWNKLVQALCPELFRVAKPQAHLYMFCDIDHFVQLKQYIIEAGWDVFRTPIIWHNPTSMRAPWPERGPQRKWQMCLYAVKGDRNVTQLFPDLVSCPSDDNLGWAAQKPVALYRDLLRRSIRPGDSVLDPFCGTGTIFPAAHDLKCRATGVEVDESAVGIAMKRLEGLV